MPQLDDAGVRTTAALIPVGDAVLEGDLSVPNGAKGLVIFAHGSGSSRMSPRNREVAHGLNDAQFATLLFDLLTREEEVAEAVTRHLRVDITMLARRLVGATDWAAARPELASMPIGYFGASTGAAAALVAAAERPRLVRAVVSRGGRPDLARGALPQVMAPTLLIVGGEDLVVINFNRDALTKLQCMRRLRIVQGATHLFEEPGAMAEVAALAREWFETYLVPAIVGAE